MSESIANRVRSGWPAGSGEMAERSRCLDWAGTPLVLPPIWGRSPADAAKNAMFQVTAPIIGITLVLMAVFVP